MSVRDNSFLKFSGSILRFRKYFVFIFEEITLLHEIPKTVILDFLRYYFPALELGQFGKIMILKSSEVFLGEVCTQQKKDGRSAGKLFSEKGRLPN